MTMASAWAARPIAEPPVIQKPGVAESPTCDPSSVLGPAALSHHLVTVAQPRSVPSYKRGIPDRCAGLQTSPPSWALTEDNQKAVLRLASSAGGAGAADGPLQAGWRNRHCPTASKFCLTQRICDLKLLLTGVQCSPELPMENMTPGASAHHPSTPCWNQAVAGSSGALCLLENP